MNPCTDLVVEWALSKPVLTKWLAEIAHDNLDDELIFTVFDLLDPQRNVSAAAFLKAVGAPFDDADTAWLKLTNETADWAHVVDWGQVRMAVLDEHRRLCDVLCEGVHASPQCST